LNFLILILSFFLGRFTIPIFQTFLFQSNYVKKNYEGINIPYSMGILYILNILFITPLFFISIDRNEIIILILILLGCLTMAFVGLIDDYMGTRDVTGLKGHIKMLIRKRITTGGIKAITGIIIAIIISIIISRTIVDGIINIFLITLFSNFINLLDLRPGRALKTYIIISGLFLPFLNGPIGLIMISTIGISLSYFPYDVRAESMLGDTGSNSLGIILGIAATFFILPIKITILMILIFIQVYAEKKSISYLIDNNKVLQYIDNLGRKTTI